MSANLPPQFFSLNAKLKKAGSNEEKISILEEMLAVCPKHKGTERVQEEIKKKIAKLKKAQPKKAKREEIYFVKKEGAGQVLVLGPPNSGKTSLTNLLCQTNLRVERYPFTTQLPAPGMMHFENIQIQIVDSPPLSKDFKPGWMKALAKNADLILALNSEILDILDEWEIEKEKVLVLKGLPGSKEKIEDLKRRIFQSLKIVRIYTKESKKKINFSKPFILKKGSRAIDLAEEIDEGLAKEFKGAKLYKKDLKRFQMVGRNYVLMDGDIIEIKT